MTPSSGLDAEIVYYANGRIKHEGVRLDGELHGSWRWYRTDGTLMRSGESQRVAIFDLACFALLGGDLFGFAIFLAVVLRD